MDFSGAVDAGRRIWIAHVVRDSGVLYLDSCWPAEALPDADRSRDRALRALRVFIGGQIDAAFGLDFPFSLQRQFIPEVRWEDFLQAFPERYPSPAAFYESTHAAGGGEPKRRTDRETKAPFAPNNQRLYRQTYHGIRDLLRPLVLEGQAQALPFHEAVAGYPWLLEVCPAAVLKHHDLYVHYKGSGTDRRYGRQRILTWLEDRAPLRISSSEHETTILEDRGGDALDSVIAAVATAWSLEAGAALAESDDLDRIEGRVYTGAQQDLHERRRR